MKDFKAFIERFVLELLHELILVVIHILFSSIDNFQLAGTNFVQTQPCNVHNTFV